MLLLFWLQLQYIDPLLCELHSHSAVGGINVWGSLRPDLNCFALCLIDNHFNNQPAGNILDKFTSEFIKVPDINGLTDINGVFAASLFYGEYKATLTLHGDTVFVTFNLVPNNGDDDIVLRVLLIPQSISCLRKILFCSLKRIFSLLLYSLVEVYELDFQMHELNIR